MPNLIHVSDPFDLGQNKYSELTAGKSLAVQLGIEKDDDQFEVPTVVLINGEPVMREVWSKYILKDDDKITTVITHGGVDPLTIAAIVISLVSVATVLLAPSPSAPSIGSLQSAPEADPVFSISGQHNKSKLSQSIEVNFGEFRHWPSYASAPWNEFDGNNQEILHALLCVGEGTYNVLSMFIEDTPLASFNGASYVVYTPGQTVTVFGPNVETAPEVNQVQLFASNEPEYETWGTNYVVTRVGSLTTDFQFDVQTPRGLFYQEDNGTLSNMTVSFKVRYRQIDEDGVPITGFTESSVYSITAGTTTVQRKTYTIAGLTPARYEFSAIRTDTKDLTTKASHQIDLVRVKSFNQGGASFADQTTVAVTLTATNRINNNTQNRINGRFQRLMDVYNAGTKVFDALQVTKSPIDAIISLLREPQHGNVADGDILLDELATMRTQVAGEGVEFNWLFERNASVRDAVNTIATTINGKIIVDGTDFTIWRDIPQTISKAMFQPNNMVMNSFAQEISMENASDAFDGIEVEYTDERDWLPRTILCKLADEAGANPERLRIEGVTNRTHAFRLGMRRRSAQRYERDNIRFATDIEGFLPNFGDRILVGHDVPKWSQFGRVVSIDEGMKIITVDNLVDFAPAETHNMMIKTRLGAVHGPFVVTQGAGYNEIDYASAEDFSDLLFDNNFELPLFQVGAITKPFLPAKIVFMKSQKSGEQVTMTCTNYDSRVYDFDTATP